MNRPPREGVGHALADAFEATATDLARRCSPATVGWFRCQREILLAEFGAATSLADIGVVAIEAMIDSRLQRVSASSVNHYLRALSLVFAWAIRHGVVLESPLRLVRQPRSRPPLPDVLSQVEVEEALRFIRKARMPRSQRDADIAEVLFFTGLRRSEIARLEKGDVDIASREIRVNGKTGHRVIPLHERALKPLARLCAVGGPNPSAPIIPGGPATVTISFRRWRARLPAHLGKRWHAHALRHSFVTALVRRGVDPFHVAALAGHRHIATTQRYVSFFGGALREALAML